MLPPGLREVERARADGHGEAAYASQSRATVPGDPRAALDAAPGARDFFDTLGIRDPRLSAGSAAAGRPLEPADAHRAGGADCGPSAPRSGGPAVRQADRQTGR
ncbi:hypothetical protein HTV45_23600 [Streptomyces sp. CHD11]|uniref:hypothetical protein n=1 Tax=Streptomyces sp. CHD11 TaxID=2741325 RepID=UPI001BFC03CB|nr:hypothetical protein [Streptomyces sp. CHD11]MBT3153818.1 hypothetical protein [Streptomyces sp. CHD11]